MTEAQQAGAVTSTKLWPLNATGGSLLIGTITTKEAFNSDAITSMKHMNGVNDFVYCLMYYFPVRHS